MKPLNLKKIVSLNGAKINYTNDLKKPLLSIKVKWKDDKYTWEDSKNISHYSLVKYEDYIWKKIGKNLLFSLKDCASDHRFISYIIDNSQRKALHYFPINKSYYNLYIMTKNEISSTFRDYSNRTPLELLLNYFEYSAIKAVYSSMASYESSLTNILQIHQLIMSKSCSQKFNNKETELSLLKLLKILILTLYFKLPNPRINTLIIGDLESMPIVKLPSSNIYQKISNNNISYFSLLNLKESIISKGINKIISRRKQKESLEMLQQDYSQNKNDGFGNKSYWVKTIGDGSITDGFKNSLLIDILKTNN
uniref:Uncharacterized protein n=1 Tax=Amorphochlora amoebiformis TaxID=1561963 RepID=A0A7S0GR18_9EUKA|mmetsp:Transcript_14343/g.22764  ORF Transcript_14343/g.22764 Transcript_14343/m.22764 type:complete len:308 (+) Transcript_14343:2171-3094(+)